MNSQKKVAAINDISCIGKCSLTVALPLLSAAGFETCPVPTAILSTHTGDFEGYTFHDLTSELSRIFEHWKTLNLHFDAVYSGYLGSFEQLNFSESFIDFYGDNSLVLVDPVMGDHGVLYAGFDEKFVKGMRNLCRKADIIIPNITEACFLTDTPYREQHSKEYISELLKKLSHITSGTVVLTGVCVAENSIGAAVMDKGEIKYVLDKKLDVLYHGTGDVFASSLLASLLQGYSAEKSAEMAVKFVSACIKRTLETTGRKHYGVNFELCIREFIDLLGI